VQNKKQGEFKEWYNDGKLKLHCYYHDDKEEGEYTEYHLDGTIRTYCLYANGKKFF